MKESLPLFFVQQLESAGKCAEEYVGISAVQICSRQEVRADHFQAVAARAVASQHQSRRLQCLLDDRDLALVELEIDNLPGLGFLSRQYCHARTSHRYLPSSTKRVTFSTSLRCSQAKISSILVTTNWARRRLILGSIGGFLVAKLVKPI